LNIIALASEKDRQTAYTAIKKLSPDDAGGVRRMDARAVDEAGQLQRPLLQTMLKIVASGEREDPHSQAAQSQPSLPF
jgi:hypothetical protein